MALHGASPQAFGDGIKRAIFESAWNHKWLRRAWLGPNVSWVGDDRGTNVGLYSAQVGWALLADVFSGHKAEEETQVQQLLSQCRGKNWSVKLHVAP